MATKTQNGTMPVDEGIAGASKEELELALMLFQQTTFAEWEAKMLAAQVQRRLDASLKAMS